LPLVSEKPIEKHGETGQETGKFVSRVSNTVKENETYMEESAGQNKVRDFAVLQSLPNQAAPHPL
jgi:hypothetical protein